jgi:hypothetical protein
VSIKNPWLAALGRSTFVFAVLVVLEIVLGGVDWSTVFLYWAAATVGNVWAVASNARRRRRS